MTRRAASLIAALCLAACGARGGLRDPDPAAPVDAGATTDLGPSGAMCTTDSACTPTGDPCVAAACVAGRCVRRPVVFGSSPREFPVVGATGHAARDGDGVVVITVRGAGAPNDSLGLQRVDLQGLLGTPIEVARVAGSRVWDADVIATREGLVVVSHAGDRANLWHLDPRGTVRGPRGLAQPGNYLTLSEADGGLVVSADRGSGCALAWARLDGQWRTATWDEDPRACPAAQVGPIGTPAWRRAVGTVPGGAWFAALTSDGRLHRTEAAPGRVQTAVSRFALADSDGAQYVRSLVAVEAGDRVAAVWVRTANDAQPATMQVREAVFDRQMRPLSRELSHDTMGLAYSPRMDIAYCHERFVSLWFDANTGSLTQNGLDGAPLTGAIKFGRGLNSIPVRLVCIPGGAVVAYQGTVSVFRCGG